MNKIPPPTQDKRLISVCRVEAGCLGPQGEEHIDKFCHFAKDRMSLPGMDFINWEIHPRKDMSHPEIQYLIHTKKLSDDQANRYLNIFGKNRETFEDEVNEKLVSLIEQYFDR